MKGLRDIIFTIGFMVALVGVVSACAANSGNQRGGDTANDDARHQIEEEFGALSDEQVAGFEREIESQYRQLQMAYQRYDQVRQARADVVKNNHDEHRLHRKLKRRHQTLARLHEDRMWLHVRNGGTSTDDRAMAEVHRAAARWHEIRFRSDGEGVEDQDAELETLRQEVNAVHPVPEQPDAAK